MMRQSTRSTCAHRYQDLLTVMRGLSSFPPSAALDPRPAAMPSAVPRPCLGRGHRLYCPYSPTISHHMGLAILILGLVIFLGAHSLVTMRPARAAAIARL